MGNYPYYAIKVQTMNTSSKKVTTAKMNHDSIKFRTECSTARWGNDIQSRLEQGELKRFAILRTAAELFNERGFYETSLNELAKRLNVTKPSLYYYFKNKDEILLQILNQANVEIAPAMSLAQQSGLCGLKKLKIFINHYTLTMTGVFGKCLVLSGLGPLESSSKDKLTPEFRRLDAFVRDILEEGIQDGSVKECDVKITAFAIFGAMHWLARWYKPDGQLSPSEIADRVFAIFESGLIEDGRNQNIV